MAKQDQLVLMAHKGQLERELAHARVTDFKDATVEQVSVGSVVEVRVSDGATTRYTILGAWDGDPEHQVISYKTPLGTALIGKRAGETVKLKTGAAEESYSIVSIARYV
jgi:transcription elongation GreA/GreB family factor